MTPPCIPLSSPISTTMKWALLVSLLLPFVAATLPPYKRFVSPLSGNTSSSEHFNLYNDHRNPEQTGLPGAHVQARPTRTSNAAILRFLSIGRTRPPGKPGSPSPSMLPPSRPGRGQSFPTQVLPPPLVSAGLSSLTCSFPRRSWRFRH